MSKLTDEQIDRRIVDLLRSVMYSSAKGGNLMADVEELGKLIAERDGVPYDEDRNRLTQAFDRLDGHDFRMVEHLNDPE